MDEDIDSEFEEETGSPFTLEVELPTSPLLQPSSFRAGSYRAGNSNLSSSYAQLLSISNQKSPNRTPISLPAYVPNRPSINAHSHRGRHDDLLAPDEDDYEENYESESDAPANAGNQYAVGSLPISISALQPRTFSNTTFDGNGRKIDKVIGSSSYRPPLPPPVQSGGEFGTAMAPLSVSK